jgi:hypothetical protein
MAKGRGSQHLIGLMDATSKAGIAGVCASGALAVALTTPAIPNAQTTRHFVTTHLPSLPFDASFRVAACWRLEVIATRDDLT